MRRLNWIGSGMAIFGALLFAAITPNALRADDFNDRTVVRFNSAVEVPGAVLQPGTYVFKILESDADRIMVQISDESERHVFTTAIVSHDYSGTPETHRDDPLDPTVGKTVMTFYEAPANQPQRLKSWFYPGQSFGFDFVYSKSR